MEEEADIKINASAVNAQLEWAGKGHLAQSKKPGREDLQAFETAYNTACGCISRGELPQAEICLKRAIGGFCVTRRFGSASLTVCQTCVMRRRT